MYVCGVVLCECVLFVSVWCAVCLYGVCLCVCVCVCETETDSKGSLELRVASFVDSDRNLSGLLVSVT